MFSPSYDIDLDGNGDSPPPSLIGSCWVPTTSLYWGANELADIVHFLTAQSLLPLRLHQ